MKKFIFTIAITLMTVATAGAYSTIVLSHNGKPTFYDHGDFNSALKAADVNDTIYLPEIAIPGFTIEKPITIIGSGQKTHINGNINILIPDSITKINSALLDGLNITGDVNMKRCVNAVGAWIRMCKMNNLSLHVSDTTHIRQLIVERCDIENNIFAADATSVHIMNSKIYKLSGQGEKPGSITINHCNISRFENVLRAIINNSIVCGYTPNENGEYNVYGTYNIHCTNISSIIFDSSYYITSPSDYFDYNGNLDCTENFEQLVTEKGWFADDGTLIGILGGNTPFTLDPSLPSVSESSVTLDPEAKTLNVKVKFTGTPTGTPEIPADPE